MTFDPFKKRKWRLAHNASLELGPRSLIMGVLNVTPDSFSDGGQYDSVEAAVLRAKEMLKQGASIIDVGGESTRPGADPVNGEEERSRVLPIINALSKIPDIIISIDTYRAETAEAALNTGAHIVNDVWGLQKQTTIAEVAAKHSAGLCIMHTGRERKKLPDVVDDQIEFLTKSLSIAANASIANDQIVLDPGIGFAKDADENLQLLDRLDQLFVLRFPMLIGTSRKRFLGTIAGDDHAKRDIATAATSVSARLKGAAIFRVHDVYQNRIALNTVDSILAHKPIITA